MPIARVLSDLEYGCCLNFNTSQPCRRAWSNTETEDVPMDDRFIKLECHWIFPVSEKGSKR
mgnify:CR=1 FL=1